MTLFQSTPSAWRETPHSATWIFDEIFQSTPSAWRETRIYISKRIHFIHFNPLPPHGGRLSVEKPTVIQFSNFNPLPPHGGRPKVLCRYCKYSDISIHSLRMEGDQTHRQGVPAGQSFQSTPSAWRETEITSARLHLVAHFNPLPPHGGRLHATVSSLSSPEFQSTPSAWRETESPDCF